VKKNPTLIDF